MGLLTMKRPIYFICFAVAVLSYVILVVCTPRAISVSLQDGGSVHWIQPSLLTKCCSSSTCVITFSLGAGGTKSVNLIQNSFQGPVMVLPSSNPNIIFCIYDDDNHYELIRIDISQQFQTLDPRSALYDFVKYSAYKIEAVVPRETNDWNFVASVLDRMPASKFKDQSIGLNLLIYRLRNSQKGLSTSMRKFGYDGPYPDEPQ